MLGREAVVLGGRERDEGSGPAVGPDYQARFWPHLYLPGVVLILSGLYGCWRLDQAVPSSFTLAFTPWMVAVVEATLVVLLAGPEAQGRPVEEQSGLSARSGEALAEQRGSEEELIPRYDPGVIDEWEKVRKGSPLSGDSDTGTATPSPWRTQNENQP